MSTNGHNHYQDWELFALGVLDGEEQRQMSAHLAAGCKDCYRNYLSAESLIASVGTLSPEAEWPAGAELRMRQKLASTALLSEEPKSQAAPVLDSGIKLVPPNASRRSSVILPWLLTAAAVLAVVGLEISRIGLLHQLEYQRRRADITQDRPQRSIEGASEPRQQVATIQKPEPDLEIESLQLANSRLEANLRELKLQLRAALSSKDATEQALAAAQNAAESAASTANVRESELETRVREAEARRTNVEQALIKAREDLAAAQSARARLEEASAQNDHIVGLLESASLSQLVLKPVGPAKASARVFWKDDKGLLLVARNLPLSSEHMSYQLWFYRRGNSALVLVGSFRVDSSGNGLLFVPPGEALLAMSGALVTVQSQGDQIGSPGVPILQAKP